jgi:hypothetical protein
MTITHIIHVHTGLSVNGTRAIRARYPNANVETDLFPYGWICGLHETVCSITYACYRFIPCYKNDVI